MKLINKTLIAAATVSSTIGLVFLGAFAYSRTSEQIVGGENQTKLQLTDLFAKGEDFVAFVSPADKETEIGTYDKESGKIIYKGRHWEFQPFFDEFLKDSHGATPIMRVSRSGLNFFNEYLEAVPPKDFIDYVDWFAENVAWGPEALTLKSFSIVRNISRNGNAVTLGGHETRTKETKTINFYPDSFFGSLPMFDNVGGPSNARDRLLQPMNSKLIDKKELNEFLNRIDRFNIIANDTSRDNEKVAFRNLDFAHFLKGKKIFNFVMPNGQTFFINAKDRVEAFSKVVEFNQKQENFSSRVSQDITLLEESTFTDVSISHGSLVLRFGENGFKQTIINQNDFSNATQNNLDELEAIMMSGIQNFRDIYNIAQYENKQYYLYDMGDENPKVFANILKAKEDLAAKYDESKIRKVILSKVQVQEGKLTLEFSNDKKEVIKTLKFDANDKSHETFSFFFLLKRAFDYKAAISPYIVKPEGDDIDPETKKSTQFYRIYNEIYQDLIETVLYKYPYLNRQLDGEHLVKYVDKDGSYKYKMEDGTYYGMDLTDRIPFLMLLAATSKDFKGVGIDFLKYVGAHEYGHHTTLQNIQNISDGNTPILLGSLSLNRSPSDNQYYNASVLREYLKARTKSLDFEQKNIDDNADSKSVGSYLFFKWKDENTQQEVTESYEDIWGSSDKNVSETIENKRRRFVQDVDGLKEAARLRGMTLAELFLMNTLDNHSATLNPLISGRAQFYDKNNDFDFPSYAKLFNSLRDGKDNPIKFKESSFDGWPIDPIVIEYEADNETVKEVKIFDSNGEPVINVKPGDTLNRQQQALERAIKSNLLSLITETFTASGWNRPSTALTLEATLAVDYFGHAKGFAGSISHTNPSAQRPVEWLKNYLENRDQEAADRELTTWQKINKGNVDLYQDISTVNGLGIDDENRVDLSTQLVDLLGRRGPLYRINKYVLRFSSNGEQYFPDEFKNPLRRNWSENITPFPLENVFYSRLPRSESQVSANPNRPYVFRLLDRRNRPMDQISASNFGSSKSVIGVDPVKLEQLDSPFDSSVFGAYLDSMLVDFQTDLDKTDGTIGKQLVKSLGFKKLEDWAEFSSIDITKISVGKKMVDGKEVLYRVFDIDYVKTKFDLAKFKSAYIAWVNSVETFSTEQKAEMLQKVATDQDTANEVMERFLKSSLQFLVKNSKTTTNFENIEAALNQTIGVNQFRERTVVYSQNPNRQNNEINAKDIYQTIQNFLELNKITVNNGQSKDNHQLTTLDAFILLGRLGFQAGIPESKEQFDNGTVFLSEMMRIYFKKWGPSEDVIRYIDNPIETNLSGIFADYTYTIPEALTRDFVQISYAAGKEDYRTLPSYVKGANESNTGYEFFLPAADTVIWSESVNSLERIMQIVTTSMTNFSTEKLERRASHFRQNVIDRDPKVILLRSQLSELDNEKFAAAKKISDDTKEEAKILASKQAGLRTANATIASLNQLLRELEYVNVNGSQVLRAIVDNKTRLENYRTTGLPSIEKELTDLGKQVEDTNKSIETNNATIANPNSTPAEIQQANEAIVNLSATLRNLTLRVNSAGTRIQSTMAIMASLEKSIEVFEKMTAEEVRIQVNDYQQLIVREEAKKAEFSNGLVELESKLKNIQNDAKKEEDKINERISAKTKEIETAINKIIEGLPKEDSFEINSLASSHNYDSSIGNVNSSYFGNVNRLNNGYFFDRWLRRELDWGIYDDKGESVKDESIRITGLKGEKVTDRAKASWIYLLKSKGVSLGTLTGNWRDKDRDANVFWGYVPLETAEKIKYLVFEDVQTGQKIYLDIKVEGTNNLFYYKKAGDESTKVTLADEGYASWTTNYTFIARYKNALILPNRSYKVYFADSNKAFVEGFSLKEGTKLLGENNKTVSQSPTYFFKKEGDEDSVYFFVQNQFNV